MRRNERNTELSYAKDGMNEQKSSKKPEKGWGNMSKVGDLVGWRSVQLGGGVGSDRVGREEGGGKGKTLSVNGQKGYCSRFLGSIVQKQD